MRSIPDKSMYHLTKPIERDPACIEINVKCSACKFEKQSDNRFRLRVFYNLDPHCEKMPDWLLNNIMKAVAGVFMKMIAAKAENLPKDYQDILVERKEYYDIVLRKYERGYL